MINVSRNVEVQITLQGPEFSFFIYLLTYLHIYIFCKIEFLIQIVVVVLIFKETHYYFVLLLYNFVLPLIEHKVSPHPTVLPRLDLFFIQLFIFDVDGFFD